MSKKVIILPLILPLHVVHWEVYNSGVGLIFCSNLCLSMLVVAKLLQNSIEYEFLIDYKLYDLVDFILQTNGKPCLVVIYHE